MPNVALVNFVFVSKLFYRMTQLVRLPYTLIRSIKHLIQENDTLFNSCFFLIKRLK